MEVEQKKWFLQVLSKENSFYNIGTLFPDGKQAYYYILVAPPKESELISAINDNNVHDISCYGKLIGSGCGKPSEELNSELSEIYGRPQE